MAVKLSVELELAITLRFDDRVGIREGRIYERGELVLVADETCELYCPLDGQGVLKTEIVYGYEEASTLPETVELERLRSAIDVTGEASGLFSPDDFERLLSLV